MKTLKWIVELEALKLNDQEKAFFEKDNQKSVFETVLNQALGSKFPNGMPGKDGRTLARIYEKLDKAPGASGSLELEEAEFELIAGAFTGDTARFMPAQFRLIAEICKNIDEAKK